MSGPMHRRSPVGHGARLIGYLWLKPAYVCDIISVVTGYMVDVAGVEASICVRSNPTASLSVISNDSFSF
jgi:hypothetical protein